MKQDPALIQAGMQEGRAVICFLGREMQFILSGCLFHTRFKWGKPHQGTTQPVCNTETGLSHLGCAPVALIRARGI